MRKFLIFILFLILISFQNSQSQTSGSLKFPKNSFYSNTVILPDSLFDTTRPFGIAIIAISTQYTVPVDIECHWNQSISSDYGVVFRGFINLTKADLPVTLWMKRKSKEEDYVTSFYIIN